MKLETFADRLNFAMNEGGYTQASLGQAIGMSQPSVWKLTTGKTQNTRKMYQIAKVLGVRPEWLEEGSGPMREGPATEPSPNASTFKFSHLKVKEWESLDEKERDEYVEVPLLNISLSAGNGGYVIDESSEFGLTFRHYYLKKVGVPIAAARVVRVTGNSMEPTLHDGDVVGVNTQDTVIRDGKTYAIRQGDLLRVKILIATPQTVIIRSINREEYPDETMTKEEFSDGVDVIGRVFWSSHTW